MDVTAGSRCSNGEVTKQINAESQNFNESIPLVKSSKTFDDSLICSGKELRRSLGFRHGFVFIAGILFGSGIFISPGLIAKETSNMGMAIVVWIIASIPCLFGALCFCELTCMYGKTGGEYLFIYKAYGKPVAFMFVWVLILVIRPIAMAVLSTTIGDHIAQLAFGGKSTSEFWVSKAIGISAMIMTTIINCTTTSLIGKLQIWFTVIQTLSVVFLVVLGVWKVSTGNTANYAVMFNNTSNFEIGSFGIAIYNGMWGYEGWGSIASLSEELKDLKRNLWLSIVTGIPFVMCSYVLVNLAYMSVLTQDQMASSSTVGTTFVENIFGKKVAVIMPIVVAITCFGSLNASMFARTRTILSAARVGQLPFALSFIHKKHRTPVPAVLSIFTMAMIWTLAPGIDREGLIAIFSLAIWTQYVLAIFSVIVMHIRRPDLERPYKVWLINPIFTCIVGVFLVIIPFVKRPIESSICWALLLSALPVYFVFIKKHESLPSCLHQVFDVINDFLRRKCNLVPCIYVAENDIAENSNGVNNESYNYGKDSVYKYTNL